METKETPLMDLTPKLFATVTSCQNVLAEWILPDSKTSDVQALRKLLDILDNKELVSKMKEAMQ